MHNVSLHKTCKEKYALPFYKWLSSSEMKFSRDNYAGLTDLFHPPGFLSDPLSPLSDFPSEPLTVRRSREAADDTTCIHLMAVCKNRSDGCACE